MSDQKKNLELIKRMENADFSSEDFVNGLAEQVEWWVAGPKEILPWAGSYRGREAVREWVAILRENLKYDRWGRLNGWFKEKTL